MESDDSFASRCTLSDWKNPEKQSNQEKGSHSGTDSPGGSSFLFPSGQNDLAPGLDALTDQLAANDYADLGEDELDAALYAEGGQEWDWDPITDKDLQDLDLSSESEDLDLDDYDEEDDNQEQDQNVQHWQIWSDSKTACQAAIASELSSRKYFKNKASSDAQDPTHIPSSNNEASSSTSSSSSRSSSTGSWSDQISSSSPSPKSKSSTGSRKSEKSKSSPNTLLKPKESGHQTENDKRNLSALALESWKSVSSDSGPGSVKKMKISSEDSESDIRLSLYQVDESFSEGEGEQLESARQDQEGTRPNLVKNVQVN